MPSFLITCFLDLHISHLFIVRKLFFYEILSTFLKEIKVSYYSAHELILKLYLSLENCQEIMSLGILFSNSIQCKIHNYYIFFANKLCPGETNHNYGKLAAAGASKRVSIEKAVRFASFLRTAPRFPSGTCARTDEIERGSFGFKFLRTRPYRSDTLRLRLQLFV